MNRRPRLPGADELFRSTGGATTNYGSALAEVATEDPQDSTERADRPVEGRRADAVPSADANGAGWDDEAGSQVVRPVRIGRRAAESRPTGRERHDEKITVYCSPEELFQIEQARLTLRGSHSLAVDRGRIVREAIAVVLADLEAKGDASILVRRLRGR
ncbi:MAG: hypothetical protein QOJ62_727 [Actinomycetota bacterium]|jgi:hypothetical protein|nr:hypothetical protein [Actinomycetota bacterium]